MKKRTTILLVLICLLTLQVNATHVSGGEITYKEISSKKYEVKYMFYRNCGGIPLNTSGSGANTIQIKARCASTGTLYTLSAPTFVSVQQIPYRCDTGSAVCSSPNSTFSGDGIEKFVFLDTLDFNTTPLSNIANCSGDIVLEMYESSRGGDITTGPGNTNFYCRAIMKNINTNRNSSPDFLYSSNAKLCCNQPARLDFTATDADGDSLSYHFAYPQQAFNSNVAYSGSFAYYNPITVYYPSGLSYPTSIPTSNPPIGINLNPVNGQLIFTPTNCNEVTLFNIEVKEWRKNSTGTYVHIGSIYRESELVIYTCQSNQSPKIVQDTASFTTCENREICFNIPTTDSTINSSGATVVSSDTLKMTWNNSISGATFTLLDSTALFKTGRFCWTPPEGSISETPYLFTVNVRDQNCPITGQDNKAFSVIVEGGPTSAASYSYIGCGRYLIDASYDSTEIGANAVFKWVVTDSNNNIISNGISFASTNNGFSESKQDTVVFDSSGTYILRFTVNGDNSLCKSTDTVTLNYNRLSLSFSNMDSNVCTYIPYTLNSTVSNSSGFLSYQWFRNNTMLVGDTFSNVIALFNQQKIDTTFTLRVTDSVGCIISDSVRLYSYNNYKNGFDSTYSACIGDTITLNVKPDYSQVKWSNGARTSSINLTTPSNIFVFYTDSFGCRMKENIRIYFDSLPTLSLLNDTSCGDTLILNAGNQHIYLWSTGDTSSSITVYSNGDYWVEVTNIKGCKKRDTAQVTIYNNTNVYLGRDTNQCGGTISLFCNVAGNTLWNNGDTTRVLILDSSGTYYVEVTDMDGCQSSDTILVEIYTIPAQSWPDTSTFCSDTGALISSKVFAHYLWNTADTTQSIHINSGGIYSIYFEDNQGCSNTDSIYVILNSLPVVELGMDTTFCGTSLLLDAGNHATYSWNSGSRTRQFTANISGTYSVEVTDSNLCRNADSISIFINAIPNFNLGNDTAFCGDSLLLALAPGNAYTWSTGDSLSFTSINASGDYWVQLTDSNGCLAADTVHITLLSNTNVPLLTKVGNVITSNLGGMHRWFMNENMINGQSDSFITISSIGSYTAVSIDSNGCISDTSNSIIRTAEIDKLSNSTIKIYPNPTNGQVTIDATGLGNINSVKLYDNLGKQVANTQTINGSTIDLAWEARSGVLWVVVETDKGMYRQAVVSER